jgi:hypothetical protein
LVAQLSELCIEQVATLFHLVAQLSELCIEQVANLFYLHIFHWPAPGFFGKISQPPCGGAHIRTVQRRRRWRLE